MGLPICATYGESFRQAPVTGVPLVRDPVTKQTEVAGVRDAAVPPGQVGATEGVGGLVDVLV
jgi:hypothetical protein